MSEAANSFPLIYEISTRPWLYQLSSKYGSEIKLSNVPDSELDSIKSLGFDVVWMMGMWALGPYGLHHDQTTPSLLQSYAQVRAARIVLPRALGPHAPRSPPPLGPPRSAPHRCSLDTPRRISLAPRTRS